ncbi:MAG: Phospholipase/lecithinase/hemolysin, partial [uncultured Ramlibacter sp.]
AFPAVAPCDAHGRLCCFARPRRVRRWRCRVAVPAFADGRVRRRLCRPGPARRGPLHHQRRRREQLEPAAGGALRPLDRSDGQRGHLLCHRKRPRHGQARCSGQRCHADDQRADHHLPRLSGTGRGRPRGGQRRHRRRGGGSCKGGVGPAVRRAGHGGRPAGRHGAGRAGATFGECWCEARAGGGHLQPGPLTLGGGHRAADAADGHHQRLQRSTEDLHRQPGCQRALCRCGAVLQPGHGGAVGLWPQRREQRRLQLEGRGSRHRHRRGPGELQPVHQCHPATQCGRHAVRRPGLLHAGTERALRRLCVRPPARPLL